MTISRKLSKRKVRIFEKGASIDKSLQAYSILVGMAVRSQITTYKDLARDLGYENEKGFTFVAQFLWPLAAWCKQRNLPILPGIIVNHKKGFPQIAEIYGNGEDWAAELQRVFSAPWYSYYAPSEAELNEAVEWARDTNPFNL